MSTITVRMNDEEKKMLENYAEFYGKSMAAVLKEAFIEKIEDEIDMEKIELYEKEGKNEKSYTLDEVAKELGFN